MYTKITTAQEKRNQLKSQIDDFASFQWNGHDMFEDYGAFIINNKGGSLKMYNGAGFTNEYVKPQFSDQGSFLTGINFDNQKIEFEIGLYCFTMAEYRQFLECISPYVISDLIFSFNTGWRYICKLANRQDSTKYIIGQSNGEYYYYTEMKLTFEIQGRAEAVAVAPWNWNNAATRHTDLSTPIDMRMNFTPTIETVKIKAIWNKPATAERQPQQTLLFSITLSHLTPNTEYSLQYLSRQGVLLFGTGQSTNELINLTTSDTTGHRVVDSLEINKFLLPGFISEGVKIDNEEKIMVTINDETVTPETFIYSRTSII